jgi:hypothetical protein
MTDKKELLKLFKANTGKTIIVAKKNELRGQAEIHKKFGYQTSNLKEYFR